MKRKTENTDGIFMQFNRMKEKHPDAILLFRIGDTYQTFREEAVKASTILDIKGADKKVDGAKTRVVSFPHHALDTYLPKLVRAGIRVAICEQLEKPRRKRTEKENSQTVSESDMPRKKKGQAAQEESVKSVKSDNPTEEKKPEVKAGAKTEVKSEAKTEQSKEVQTERQPREPQMITVNGDKVTHGHAYQCKTNPEDWYFTAKMNGEQLKPQKMDPADLAAYQKKEMTVPQLMERYYPTKLMEKVPEAAYKVPNVIAAAGTNSSSAAWVADLSGGKGELVRSVFFCESAFDAMAFYQMNRARLGNNITLVSLGGAFSDRQVTGVMERFPNARAFDCFDNDLAGRIYALRMMALLENISLKITKTDIGLKVEAKGKSIEVDTRHSIIPQITSALSLRYRMGQWPPPKAYKDWNDCLQNKPMMHVIAPDKNDRDISLVEQRKSSLKI